MLARPQVQRGAWFRGGGGGVRECAHAATLARGYLTFLADPARSNATCYGYGHAIDGRQRFAIEKDTLVGVEGQRQCNKHWQALRTLKQVRASSGNGGHAPC